MALEALADPLSALRYLPRGMNYATAEEVATNEPYWSATHQYVKNDVCLSGVDEGAYIFLGGSANSTAILDGGDPSTNPDWVSLRPVGVNSLSGPIVPVAAGGAVPAYTVTNGSLTVPELSTWNVTWQCVATKAAAMIADDFIKWTLTAGANSVTICQPPLVDAANVSSTVAASAVIVVPTGVSSIVLTGTTAAGSTSSVLVITGAKLSAVRLS